MPRKRSARAPKWAVILALALLLATTALAAAQAPDLHLPLIKGEGETAREAPEPPWVEEEQPLPIAPETPLEESDPNAPVGDSRDTISGDQVADLPAEEASVNAFNATQWTVQNNVGIGTQTPTVPLDIERNVNAYTRLLVRNPNGGNSVQTQLLLDTGSNNGLVVQQFGQGFVGSWNGKSLTNMARLRTTQSVKGLILTTGGNYPLLLGSADQERMRIASDGRVGIGTTTLAHRLSIAAGPSWTSNLWSGTVDLPNGGAIGWRTNNNGYSFGIGQTYDGFYIFHTTAAPATTGSAAAYDLKITNSGNVGIGTTEPTYKLHVVGTTRLESAFDGVDVYEPGYDGVYVQSPGINGVHVYNPGRFGLTVQCPCGSEIHPNTGVIVFDGNIRVVNGSFIDSGAAVSVPDYVFEPEYPLMSLDELRTYVAAEKHLPNVPDEEEIRAGGLDLSDFQMKLLEKTEELTLYTLAQDEQIERLQQENQAKDEQLATMKEMIADLETRLAALEEQE